MDTLAVDVGKAALDAAARWRLPFARQPWRGAAGNWAGTGTGSSLDFQDHRNYVPGDDPRYIHWQAYARTGALTMKLYRAEVAPYVDVVVDVSASMAVTPEKAVRAAELLAFCVASADRAGAPVRIHAAAGRKLRALSADQVRSGRVWDVIAGSSPAPDGVSQSAAAVTGAAAGVPGPIAWRPGALRVLISDLLYPEDPGSVIVPLAASGAGIVFAPAVAQESELGWRGNIELTDCETGDVRRQRIDDALADRYREAYRRHFALWREAARRRGVLLARVPAGASLAQALGGEAFQAGAVEATA